MYQKKIPLRKCTGCGEMKEKKQLVRIVRAPETEGEPVSISLDLIGKKPGRGAYICNDPACLTKARKARRLEKAFQCRIPDEIYAQLEEQLSRTDS